MKWVISPYEGVSQDGLHAIKFGMNALQAERAFCPYESKIERSSDYINAYFPGVETPILGFKNDYLIDIGFGWRTEAVFVCGMDHFHTAPRFFLEEISRNDKYLMTDGHDAFFSPKFGIAFDLLDLDESDKTIWAYSREELERILVKCTPFRGV